MNEYINITLDNIDKEHLCCAISDKKHQDGVNNKKEWLKKRIKEGHTFRKLNANGKVFIEYAPIETAWVPIEGNNFIYIYCLWVAGSFKKHGYATELLNYAIENAKKNGKSGICIVSSKSKKPFVSDKSFFIKNGFKVVDSIGDYELLSLSFDKTTPNFIETSRKMKIDNKELTIYYSPECPFVINCINEAKEYMNENNVIINFIAIDSVKKAKSVPCVFNNWAVFKNGEFVSNTLLNKNSIDKLLKK